MNRKTLLQQGNQILDTPHVTHAQPGIHRWVHKGVIVTASVMELAYNGPCPVVQRTVGRDGITFTGKLREPVHNWFRMTASFSPEYVREVLRRERPGLVLDPYSGVGTTVLEARRQRIAGYAVELNPFLHIVSHTKAHVRDSDAERFKDRLNQILTHFKRNLQTYSNCTIEEYRSRGGEIPKLTNIERWWIWDNLCQVLCLRDAIYSATHEEDKILRGFFLIALGKVAMACSNSGAGRVSLSFLEKTTPRVDVPARFTEEAKRMCIDILMALPDCPPGDVFFGDSTNLSTILPLDIMADCIITSPPYPNRFTYTRETRPLLYLFDLMTEPREAGDLDCRSLGGTWGRAWTTINNGNIQPINSDVRDAMGDEMINNLEDADIGMRSYCTKYFNDIWRQITSMRAFVHRNTSINYVVGNSFLKGVEIPTDLILARIFENVGFKPLRIERLRKRHSKAGLYEAVVVARGNPA